MKSIFGKNSDSSTLASIKRIGGVLIPLAIIIFLTLHQANFLIGRSLLIAFGDTESTYKSAWFEWDGDVVARDLVIYPYDLGEDFAIRAERVHVETPGWFWFVRNTFNRSRLRAKMDQVHLTLSGVTSVGGLDPSLGDLGPFGPASASPFEAEGCTKHTYWDRDELAGWDLELGASELEFDYQVAGKLLKTRIRLETPGASRVVLERIEDLPRRINALLLDQYPTLTLAETWSIDDLGFIRARNKACAGQDGVDRRTFVERHVQSVQRLLEMGGLQVDEASLAAYRKFTRDGGSLRFAATYREPIHSDVLYESRDSGAAMLNMNAVLEHADQRLSVGFVEIEPRPLPGWDDGLPTYAALRRELGDISEPAISDGGQRISVRKSVANVDMQEAGEADPAIYSDRLGPPKAAELPPKPEPPKVTAAPPPDPRIPWDQLDQFVGSELRVLTAQSGNRTVELMAAGPDEILVRARLGGGHAEYRIRREVFREAVKIR